MDLNGLEWTWIDLDGGVGKLDTWRWMVTDNTGNLESILGKINSTVESSPIVYSLVVFSPVEFSLVEFSPVEFCPAKISPT